MNVLDRDRRVVPAGAAEIQKADNSVAVRSFATCRRLPKTEGTSGWVDNTAATLSRLKLHVAELDELLSEYEAERAVAWMFIGFRQQPPTTKFQSDVFAGFAQCDPPCELAPCWHSAFHPSPSI
jgi:hypothetical protein